MRTFSTQAREWLTAFSSGKGLSGERRESQALSDLRGAGLVEAQSKKLTPFGKAVLDRWRELSLPPGFEAELPLAVGLLLEALGHEIGQYLDRLAFWWDVRGLYDVDDLLANHEALLLLPYLNQTRAEFNPWAALLGAGFAITGPIDWGSLKAAIPAADDATDAALDQLEKKTTDSRPVAARIVFCRAMEFVFMSRFEAERVPGALAEMALPERQ